MDLVAGDVTRRVVDYVLATDLAAIPDDVRKEARRALLNYVGCALGGCRHDAVDRALAALGPYSGPAGARVLGRPERVDPLLASLLNGISSHVHDFDDTTPANYIHCTSPVASARLEVARQPFHLPVAVADRLHAAAAADLAGQGRLERQIVVAPRLCFGKGTPRCARQFPGSGPGVRGVRG